MEKIIGIYKITSPSGNIYIGQSVDIINRKRQYNIVAKNNHQPKLYSSIKKYGFNAHSFDIIEICQREKLNEREIYWGEFYNVYSDKGMNLRQCGGSKGKHCQETKNRISVANKKAFQNPETREKCRIQNLGRKRTDETRKIQSESKKRLYASGYINPKKGKGISEETRRRLRDSHLGHKQSKETIAKIVSKNKGRKRTQEQLRNLKSKFKGVSKSKQFKLKVSEGLKRYFAKKRENGQIKLKL